MKTAPGFFSPETNVAAVHIGIAAPETYDVRQRERHADGILGPGNVSRMRVSSGTRASLLGEIQRYRDCFFD